MSDAIREPETGETRAAGEAAIRRAVDDAVARYAAERRRRIPGFVDENFSLRGAIRLHRHAVGWDMARAPANLALAVPHLALKTTAALSRTVGARRFGDWLDRRPVFLSSDVGRELEWRLFTRLLELPYAQPGRPRPRRFHRDALAEEIFRDPEIDQALRRALRAVGRRADDPRLKEWLTDAMTAYTGTRVAAADLANALITAGVGALAFKQMTPGMLTLGPTVAQAMAQHAAIASFPLGAGIGGVWYGTLPVAASAPLVAGVTGGLMAMAAVLAAFSGVVTDPVQRRLGLHRRRLVRLVDALEAELRRDGAGRFTVRDHYVARVFDLLDLLRTAQRVAG
ncbi:MAG TPA: DUF6635 family protein [Alphaproteobacteria bacterium]|nr:DUF6635 family protein [Alphaproteobacteria bacterium]